MINLIACTNGNENADPVLDCMERCCVETGERLNILCREECPEKLSKRMKDTAYTLLTLMELSGREKRLAEKLRLAKEIQAQNRDNMLLLLTNNLQYLEVFVNFNTQPNGVMIIPVDCRYCEPILKRVVKQYMVSLQTGADRSIVLKTSGGARRVRLSELLYVEANSKRLNFYTETYCISTNDSLKGVLETLGEGFIQCHRSYLVNRNYIVATDVAAMELEMSNGVRVPFSRSAKQEIKESMNERIGGA